MSTATVQTSLNERGANFVLTQRCAEEFLCKFLGRCAPYWVQSWCAKPGCFKRLDVLHKHPIQQAHRVVVNNGDDIYLERRFAARSEAEAFVSYIHSLEPVSQWVLYTEFDLE